MNPLRHWKFASALAAVIAASLVAGALAGHRMARRRLETRNDPVSWNQHVMEEFDRTVSPTPEQAARLQKHLDVAVGELKEIRADTIRRSTNVIGRLVADVERELTPEQARAFERMKPKPGELTLDVLKVR
jgi:hypothetical protein